MCLPPGEILGTEGPESPWSLKKSNSVSDGTNERRVEVSGRSLEKEKSQIFLCSTDIFEIQYSPEKDEFPFALEVQTLPQTL